MDSENIQPDGAKVPLCKCKDDMGVPCFAVHRVSKTDKNKDRGFYACSVSKDKGGCGFFCWVEDLYIDEKTGLAKKKYVPLPDGYVKKPTAAETLIAHDLRLIQLEEQQQQLLSRIAQLEEKLKSTEHELQSTRPAKVQKTEHARVAGNHGRKQ